MNGALLVRFSILIAAEIFFFDALNLFDDWTFQQMPVRFGGTAFASGIAFLAAVSHFPPKVDLRKLVVGKELAARRLLRERWLNRYSNRGGPR